MFAVGHMAIAYLLGKSSAKLLKTNPNIPLIIVLSILPDADILLGAGEYHRGPTHSLILALILFIPFFLLYRRKAIPYFLALISHSLICDFIIGGQIMLLWPLTTRLFGFNNFGYNFEIWSPFNITLELTLFTAATIIMAKTRDISKFFQNRKSNLLLAIPIATVLLPTFVNYPIQVPLLIMPPHFFYLVLFSISILAVIARLPQSTETSNPETLAEQNPI